jgi:hypothetical protein
VLAGQSRIKYRIPCALPPESLGKLAQPELDELGLSPGDREILTAAHRRSNARIWGVVRPHCLKIVGDGNVERLGTRGCLNLMRREGMADAPAFWRVRRQVGEVRAGVLQPDQASERQHPLFEVYMALTSEAERFEADLAQSLGPDDARSIWRTLRCVETAGVQANE